MERNGSDERRRSPRVSYPCEVRCYGVGEALYATRLTDVSETGAFVETPIELPLGSVVLLRFEAAGRRLRLQAEVVHHKPGAGLGLRFLELGPEQREAIGRIVAEAQ